MSSFHKRLSILTLLLLVGFALRLHNLTVPDLNIDETWSFLHSYYLGHPSGYSAIQILSPEPNNAFHLILSSITLLFVPGAFGMRWLSVCVGILTIAVAARIAFRLYGRRTSLITAVIVMLAYNPVYYSQIARPYALATLLASLSLLFWLEKRTRLNMLTSIFVPLAHIGAMPVIAIQDLLTLVRVAQGKRVNKLDWIVRRIPVYGAFFLIIYMVYLRRHIHVISKGQSPPSPAQLLYQTLNTIHTGFPTPTPAAWLFLIGVVVPFLVIVIVYWRRLPKNLNVPLLWIAASYGFLIAGAVLSDGPINWNHISHVSIAVALIIAAVLSRVPRVAFFALVAFCIANIIMLVNFYQHPYRYAKDVRAAIDTFRTNNEPVYLGQSTIIWTLQVNNPDADYIILLPDEAERPLRYLYVNRPGWLPPPPAECDQEPLWDDKIDLQILQCRHE